MYVCMENFWPVCGPSRPCHQINTLDIFLSVVPVVAFSSFTTSHVTAATAEQLSR
jgi:hypothetical protein